MLVKITKFIFGMSFRTVQIQRKTPRIHPTNDFSPYSRFSSWKNQEFKNSRNSSYPYKDLFWSIGHDWSFLPIKISFFRLIAYTFQTFTCNIKKSIRWREQFVFIQQNTSLASLNSYFGKF